MQLAGLFRILTENKHGLRHAADLIATVQSGNVGCQVTACQSTHRHFHEHHGAGNATAEDGDKTANRSPPKTVMASKLSPTW